MRLLYSIHISARLAGGHLLCRYKMAARQFSLLHLPREYVYRRVCEGRYMLGCVWHVFHSYFRLFVFALTIGPTFCPLSHNNSLFSSVLRPTFQSLSASSFFFPFCDFLSAPGGGCHASHCRSVQPGCGPRYCMHMQFNYWCSPLTASSAL